MISRLEVEQVQSNAHQPQTARMRATGYRIVSIHVGGGFLDGLEFQFSDGLNCFIGARGAGKTTAVELIRYALDLLPLAAESSAGTQFQGGPLVFRRTTVDLLGVTIVSNRGSAQAMSLLRDLARHDAHGRFVHLSGEGLAHGLAPPATIGTVTSCVRLIRSTAPTRLNKQLGLVVGPQDVIAHDGQGYYLRNWITIQDADAPAPNVPAAPLKDEIVPQGDTRCPRRDKP
ncbi:MAG: ATP-binding protein [Pirellulaceae bacterium]